MEDTPLIMVTIKKLKPLRPRIEQLELEQMARPGTCWGSRCLPQPTAPTCGSIRGLLSRFLLTIEEARAERISQGGQ